MLVSSYVNGFGAASFGAAQSLTELLQRAAFRQKAQAGFGRHGLGADLTNYQQFLATRGASYHNLANDPVPGTPAAIVFCKKNVANNPECQLMSATVASGRASTGPVAAMQRAADRIMNAIPAFKLGGRQMKGPVPTGDGTTTAETTFTVVDNGINPIGSRAGYDGVLGPNALGFVSQALTLAGMLKQVPNSVALAFVSPGREDIITMFAGEIAAYLNGVADNFDRLLADFTARGNVPASTPLDVTTIPAVIPLAGEKKRPIGAILGAAAAMISLTAIGAVAAAKHKPAMAYEDDEAFRPALGRRRHRGLKPRGW